MSDRVDSLDVFVRLYGKYFFLLIIIIIFFAALTGKTVYDEPEEKAEEMENE
jgi:preprotein translocase subunit SecY